MDEPESLKDEESGSYESTTENSEPSLDIESQNRRSISRLRTSIANHESLNDNSGSRASHINEASSSKHSEATIVPQLFPDAQTWASNFIPPASSEDISSPQRRHSRSKRKGKPPHEVRAKRLRTFYSNDYRELLNDDIQQAATKMYQAYHVVLEDSQVGSSIWTAREKHMLFTALATSGKDDLSTLSVRIGTKSKLEIRHYIQLLHEAKLDPSKQRVRLLDPVDLPAAFEISDECCDLLERAGDSVAVHQESRECNIEQEKWGEIWLVTAEVCQSLEKLRKEENGLEEMEELFPAANLFNIKNWVEMAERIFMNPAAPRGDENWNMLTEAGEYPAVRATAFEDFHSLALSITKRLISTTLYCTMSRLRAQNSNKIKHAEISVIDVEAAVKILKLTADATEFWKGCARRCNLQVYNDEVDEDEDKDEDDDTSLLFLTYDEVEEALATTSRRRSRSRSLSRAPRSTSFEVTSSAAEDVTSPKNARSGNSSELESPSDYPSHSSDESETDLVPTTRDERLKLAKIRAERAAVMAQDDYMEAVDMHASRKEEARLWAMLKQTIPPELEIDREMVGERPRAVRDSKDGENWREYTEYWSEWETLETPVPERAFEMNRKCLTRRGRWRRRQAEAGKLIAPEEYNDHTAETDQDESDSDDAPEIKEEDHSDGSGEDIESHFDGDLRDEMEETMHQSSDNDVLQSDSSVYLNKRSVSSFEDDRASIQSIT